MLTSDLQPETRRLAFLRLGSVGWGEILIGPHLVRQPTFFYVSLPPGQQVFLPFTFHTHLAQGKNENLHLYNWPGLSRLLK